ncbi:galactose mutarotase isoform X5 [Chrysemys picta bellii]|uniref:galactose mutarotase isoform X5 n=2 Tax=Chrysemys picta bellii TaxID=8478 RepID=UPI0032B2E55B
MRLQLSFRLAEYWLASLFQRGARKTDIQLWGEMTEVTREVFGHLPQKGGGGAVEKFLLKSDRVQVEIISLGCIITALETKGRDGNLSDIVLGFDRLEGYVNKHPYFGATIGRVANRIANGKFTVEGKEYQLALNNPPNSLHGGNKGFDKVLWTPEVLLNGIRFSRTSPDGEEGYPGELKVWVTYTLDGGELAINYRAQSSSTTPISLTNHAYFNLAGQGSHDIYNHMVSIEADSYLPVDDTLIPTEHTIPLVAGRWRFTPLSLGSSSTLEISWTARWRGKGALCIPSIQPSALKHRTGRMQLISPISPVHCCGQERSITTQLGSSLLQLEESPLQPQGEIHHKVLCVVGGEQGKSLKIAPGASKLLQHRQRGQVPGRLLRTAFVKALDTGLTAPIGITGKAPLDVNRGS